MQSEGERPNAGAPLESCESLEMTIIDILDTNDVSFAVLFSLLHARLEFYATCKSSGSSESPLYVAQKIVIH